VQLRYVAYKFYRETGFRSFEQKVKRFAGLATKSKIAMATTPCPCEGVGEQALAGPSLPTQKNAAIDVLSDLFILRGIPAHVRSDNGPEFIAKALREWIALVGAQGRTGQRRNLLHIEGGKDHHRGLAAALQHRAVLTRR
jgi:hypothetical protein